MTECKCDVVSCANNEDNCCCRPDILVNGPCACGCEQTCCANFQEKSNGAENATACNCPNTALEIRCDAHNCTYNESGKCDADCVCVAGGNCAMKSQTECATFRMK